MKYLVLLLPLMTACTSYSAHHRQNYQMATVTQAQPVYRTIEIHQPKRVCEERQQIRRHADSAARLLSVLSSVVYLAIPSPGTVPIGV